MVSCVGLATRYTSIYTFPVVASAHIRDKHIFRILHCSSAVHYIVLNCGGHTCEDTQVSVEPFHTSLSVFCNQVSSAEQLLRISSARVCIKSKEKKREKKKNISLLSFLLTSPSQLYVSALPCPDTMASSDFNNPLRKFKLVFLGEQSGKNLPNPPTLFSFSSPLMFLGISNEVMPTTAYHLCA